MCLLASRRTEGESGFRWPFPPPHTHIEFYLFQSATPDFWFARVNYMSPTLNIKPNQCLIIDAIAFYTGVPLVLETSSKEPFCITVCLRLRSLATIPTHFSLVFLIDDRRKSVKERRGMENWIRLGSYGCSEELTGRLSARVNHNWVFDALACVFGERSLRVWASVMIAQEWSVIEKMVTHNARQWLFLPQVEMYALCLWY